MRREQNGSQNGAAHVPMLITDGEGLFQTILHSVRATFQNTSQVCGAHEVPRAQTAG